MRGSSTRRLSLHPSALSDAEYSTYIEALNDLLDEDNQRTHNRTKNIDDELDKSSIRLRELRAWMKGRFRDVNTERIEEVLRMICPRSSQIEFISGGQALAVLRLLTHARHGDDEVYETKVFVQAIPPSPTIPIATPSTSTTKKPAVETVSAPVPIVRQRPRHEPEPSRIVRQVQPTLSQTKRKENTFRIRIKSEDDAVIQDSDSDSDSDRPPAKQLRIEPSTQLANFPRHRSLSDGGVIERRRGVTRMHKPCDYCISQKLPCKGKPKYACEECARRHKSCSLATTGRALARKVQRKNQAKAADSKNDYFSDPRSESSDDDSDYAPSERQDTAPKPSLSWRDHHTRRQNHIAHAHDYKRPTDKFDTFANRVSNAGRKSIT